MHAHLNEQPQRRYAHARTSSFGLGSRSAPREFPDGELQLHGAGNALLACHVARATTHAGVGRPQGDMRAPRRHAQFSRQSKIAIRRNLEVQNVRTQSRTPNPDSLDLGGAMKVFSCPFVFLQFCVLKPLGTLLLPHTTSALLPQRTAPPPTQPRRNVHDHDRLHRLRAGSYRLGEPQDRHFSWCVSRARRVETDNLRSSISRPSRVVRG